jgi:hypothetical protein
MSGTVNVSRRIWNDTAFKAEPFTEREAFVWMVMEASYKAREKRIGNVVVQLNRGELATSVRFMCQAWDWSKSRVDRFLKRLENRDMIGTESGTGINVITVCKYDEYQNTPNESGTDKIKKRDSSGTAAGQQRDKPNKGLIPEAIPEAKKEKKAYTPLAVAKGADEPKSPEPSKPKKAPSRGTRLSPEWFLPKAWGDWALASGASMEMIRLESDVFKDHWLGKSGKDGIKVDWLATWRNWIRRAIERNGGTKNGSTAHNPTERVQRIVGAAAAGTSDKDWG